MQNLFASWVAEPVQLRRQVRIIWRDTVAQLDEVRTRVLERWNDSLVRWTEAASWPLPPVMQHAVRRLAIAIQETSRSLPMMRDVLDAFPGAAPMLTKAPETKAARRKKPRTTTTTRMSAAPSIKRASTKKKARRAGTKVQRTKVTPSRVKPAPRQDEV